MPRQSANWQTFAAGKSAKPAKVKITIKMTQNCFLGSFEEVFLSEFFLSHLKKVYYVVLTWRFLKKLAHFGKLHVWWIISNDFGNYFCHFRWLYRYFIADFAGLLLPRQSAKALSPLPSAIAVAGAMYKEDVHMLVIINLCNQSTSINLCVHIKFQQQILLWYIQYTPNF